MEHQERTRRSFVLSTLPWIVTAGVLVLYLVTLNHWVTMTSLPVVAKVTGWDWYPAMQAPLHYVLTFPIRWLPATWQPVALNLFAAVCAALTLGLLARSVALLPHDRTREQRQREHSEFSLLSLRAAWLPPALAVLACGLQLTFWEHATADTGEALDLLVFAYAIRCLLEYRIDRRESWLTRLALVYGLGMTNTWAMIGFFPLLLAALLWVKGAEFFNFRFLARMAAWGGLGLLLYLLLPLVTAAAGTATAGFGRLLWYELVTQKNILLNFPKYLVLLLGLTSLLPLFIISVRWPSTFGDTSIVGAALTNMIFRVVHGMFLAVCLWVAFDPKFSPRALAQVSPFLTFYYLGALCIGYFSGYFLLIFGPTSSRSMHRPSPLMRAAAPVVVGLLWLALAGVPAGLVVKNWPAIQVGRSSVLREFAAQAAQQLPAQGAVLVSDEPHTLLLVEASLQRGGQPHPHVLLDTVSLPYHSYHRHLAKRYPQRVPDLLAQEDAREPLDPGVLTQFLASLTRTNTVFYLNPSFGYFFETIYRQPHGVLYRVKEFQTDDVEPPPLSPAEVEENRAFWEKLKPLLAAVPEKARTKNPDALFVSRACSRALNSWGVALQQLGQVEEAGRCFAQAQELYADNVVAKLNGEFNQSLHRGQPQALPLDRAVETKFGQYRGWNPMLMANGPFDEPTMCFRLGQEYARNSLFRQAAQQFTRVQALTPGNIQAQVLLADMFLEGRVPDRALAVIAQMRHRANAPPLSVTNQLELVRLEALAHFSKSAFAKEAKEVATAEKELAQAEAVLLAAQKKFPQQETVLDTLAQIYWSADQLPKALAAMDQQLQLDPRNTRVLLNKAAVNIQTKDFDQARRQLDQALKLAPDNLQALFLEVSLHTQNKAFDKANATLDRILELDPRNGQALLHKAALAIEAKAYDQAFAPLNKVLKAHPENWAALMNRAIANLQSGQLEAAQRDYEKLKKIVPRLHAVYYGLGEIAFRRNRPTDAIANYELYLKYVPEGLEEAKTVRARLQELKAGAAGRK